MSAEPPVLSTSVGVVLERHPAASQWVDYTWRVSAVMAGEPAADAWTPLGKQGDVTTFYAGAAQVVLHPSDTGNYRDNLATGTPGLWVVMAPTGGDPPYQIIAVTADPSEGEAFTETATNQVEQVPMPDSIRDWVAAYVAEHHVERPFFKRKRDIANPDAMSSRDIAMAKAAELSRRGYGDHDE